MPDALRGTLFRNGPANFGAQPRGRLCVSPGTAATLERRLLVTLVANIKLCATQHPGCGALRCHLQVYHKPGKGRAATTCEQQHLCSAATICGMRYCTIEFSGCIGLQLVLRFHTVPCRGGAATAASDIPPVCSATASPLKVARAHSKTVACRDRGARVRAPAGRRRLRARLLVQRRRPRALPLALRAHAVSTRYSVAREHPA